MKSVIVPLDGSALAEAVLPAVTEIAKLLSLAVVLFRAYELCLLRLITARGLSAITMH